MTDELFEDDILEDYEPDFNDDGEVPVNPSTQISLKYGMETVVVELEEGKTIQQYLEEAKGQLQFRNPSELAVRLDSQYVEASTVPEAGQVFVISAQGDRKGA